MTYTNSLEIAKKRFSPGTQEYESSTPLAKIFLEKASAEFNIQDVENSRTGEFPSTDITIHLRTNNPRETLGKKLNELFKELPPESEKERKYLTTIHGPIYEPESLRCCLLQLPSKEKGYFTAIHFLCKPEENPEIR